MPLIVIDINLLTKLLPNPLLRKCVLSTVCVYVKYYIIRLWPVHNLFSIIMVLFTANIVTFVPLIVLLLQCIKYCIILVDTQRNSKVWALGREN